MHDHRNGARQKSQRASLLRVRMHMLLGEDLDNVDAVEVRENRRAELGPPSDSESHPPHPPHPPPQPPPHPLPHDEPHDDPHDDELLAAFGKSFFVHWNASPDSADTPNTATSSATSDDDPPEWICADRKRSESNRLRTSRRNAFPDAV